MALAARVVARQGAAGQGNGLQARLVVDDVVQIQGRGLIGVDVGIRGGVEHAGEERIRGVCASRVRRGALQGGGLRRDRCDGQGQRQHIQGEQQDQEKDESSPHTVSKDSVLPV